MYFISMWVCLFKRVVLFTILPIVLQCFVFKQDVCTIEMNLTYFFLNCEYYNDADFYFLITWRSKRKYQSTNFFSFSRFAFRLRGLSWRCFLTFWPVVPASNFSLYSNCDSRSGINLKFFRQNERVSPYILSDVTIFFSICQARNWFHNGRPVVV